MERVLKFVGKEVSGLIRLNVPSRSERLSLMQESGTLKNAKIQGENVEVGSGAMESLGFMEEQVKNRFLSCDLTISEETAFEYLQNPDGVPKVLSSWEDVDNSPVADEVMAFCSQVIFSGRLGKPKSGPSSQSPAG